MSGKLRILHVVPTLAKGGAERLALDICNNLQTYDDIDVQLIIFRAGDDEYKTSEKLKIHLIPSRYIPSLKGKPINETEGLKKFIEEFKPHVIHTHLYEAEIAVRAVGYYNAAYVCHCHDNMFSYKKFTPGTLFNKRLLTNYVERKFVLGHTNKAIDNRYIAISEDTKQYFEENLPAPLNSKIVLMLNAIDYARFSQNPLPQWPADEIRLINVGSFNPRKNQQLLVRVAKYLKDKGHNIKLTLLGNGASRPEVIQLAESLDTTSYVDIPGTVDKVETVLAQNNLFVHAAVYEPFGLVLVEAMAAGLPVIALDGKGNRDLHKDDVTGFLIEHESVEEFAEKILLLVKDKAYYEKISASARAFAKGFDIVAYTAKLLSVYKSMVKI